MLGGGSISVWEPNSAAYDTSTAAAGSSETCKIKKKKKLWPSAVSRLGVPHQAYSYSLVQGAGPGRVDTVQREQWFAS